MLWVLTFSGTILFWQFISPYTLEPTPLAYSLVAKNESYTTQKIALVNSNKTKEPERGTRLYHGILLTREGEKSYLELTFAQEGLADQMGLAEKVITCESGWLWYADNGVSKGIAQFTRATWHDYCTGDYNDMNYQQQINCMAKMWRRGLQKRWDCYRMEL